MGKVPEDGAVFRSDASGSPLSLPSAEAPLMSPNLAPIRLLQVGLLGLYGLKPRGVGNELLLRPMRAAILLLEMHLSDPIRSSERQRR